jgi:hypothetical protein
MIFPHLPVFSDLFDFRHTIDFSQRTRKSHSMLLSPISDEEGTGGILSQAIVGLPTAPTNLAPVRWVVVEAQL